MNKKLTYVAALVLVAGIACQDSSVAPQGGDTRVASGSPALAALGSRQLSQEFKIRPGKATSVNVFGVFTVNFPANSVCDPDNTASCTPANGVIRVIATLQSTNGRVWVDFKPHLQFVDSSDPSTWVTISTDVHANFIRANRDSLNANRALLRRFNILFADAIGGSTVNDVTVDGSLITHIGLASGTIWRRILHFSGYNITTGEACDPSPTTAASTMAAIRTPIPRTKHHRVSRYERPRS